MNILVSPDVLISQVDVQLIVIHGRFYQVTINMELVNSELFDPRGSMYKYIHQHTLI